MRRSDLTWGVLLVLAGIVLLMQNVGLFGTAADVIWTVLFALGVVAFLGVFVANRGHWWALIPGFTLVSLSTLMALEQLTPGGGGAWSGSIFLGGLGLSFWAIYLTQPRMWWAIIPGGTLLTLAVVAGADGMRLPFDTGALFFGGLALTFGLVYLLPAVPRRMTWALIPAGICAALSLVVLTASTAAFDYLWPAALIVIGLYFVYRTVRPAAERIETSIDAPAREERYDDTTLPQPH